MTVTEPPRRAPEEERPVEAAPGNQVPDGNPPFLVFRRRLYVLAKNPPQLHHRAGEAPAVVQKPGPRRNMQAAKGRLVAMPGKGRLRAPARRPRPYVKGPFRVYSSKFPHLAPVTDRRKGRRTSKA